MFHKLERGVMLDWPNRACIRVDKFQARLGRMSLEKLYYTPRASGGFENRHHTQILRGRVLIRPLFFQDTKYNNALFWQLGELMIRVGSSWMAFR